MSIFCVAFSFTICVSPSIVELVLLLIYQPVNQYLFRTSLIIIIIFIPLCTITIRLKRFGWWFLLCIDWLIWCCCAISKLFILYPWCDPECLLKNASFQKNRNIPFFVQAIKKGIVWNGRLGNVPANVPFLIDKKNSTFAGTFPIVLEHSPTQRKSLYWSIYLTARFWCDFRNKKLQYLVIVAWCSWGNWIGKTS